MPSLEQDLAGAISLDKARCNIGELKPLPNEKRSHPKPSGHFIDALAGLDKTLKRNELIGGMHGNPDGVFRQACLKGGGRLHDLAGNIKRFGQLLFPS